MRTQMLCFGFFEFPRLRNLFLFVFILCVLISFKNQNAVTKMGSSSSSSHSATTTIFLSPIPFSWNKMFVSSNNPKVIVNDHDDEVALQSLEYDYYRETCPQAEQIIRSVVRDLYDVRSNITPALLHLVFQDCLFQGCTASVLLNPTDEIGTNKESPPNETSKGFVFDLINIIKSNLEKTCPGIVSCADVLVLAAREAIVMAGGPFYPLHTGRRDGTRSFADVATSELLFPHEHLVKTFASRGFSERERVCLLGARSIGGINCNFFANRLHNFGGTDEPSPSLGINFLNLMKSRCNTSHTPSSSASASASASAPASTPAPSFDSSPSSSPKESGKKMDYKIRGSGFGTLFADQQLMASEATSNLVRAYSSDASLFYRDFAQAMMKLSNLRVLTAPMGQVRINCSMAA